jgi:hypothetical protein
MRRRLEAESRRSVAEIMDTIGALGPVALLHYRMAKAILRQQTKS